MALNKVPYVDGVTVITAENLNDIQDAIIALENAPAQGLTEDMKQALLQIARKVAYIDDQGQTYYDDLYDAFYPPKTVVLITAVFNQGTTVIYDDTALDDLKQYLTVTAKYDDNTTAILADSAYTLSGLLEAGTSTVTVAYNGLTTTFTVNVTARPTLSSISAVYTQSGAVYTDDTLDSLKDDLVVTAIYSDSSTQTVPAADYTLSGTLTAGTSTITVSYGGKTTTFTLTVVAPLYSIPDFAEQRITSGNYYSTVSKENGVFHYSGTYGGVVIITPSGVATTTRPTTEWFSTKDTKPFTNQAIDISWENTGNTNLIFATKFCRSDADGNLASSSLTLTANKSGENDSAEFYNAEYPVRSMSGFVIQISGDRPAGTVCSASFRIRVFNDGVRYL